MVTIASDVERLMNNAEVHRIMARLEGQEPAVLARWANEFNCWGWPEEFPIPKPADYDALPERERSAERDRFRVMRPYVAALKMSVSPFEVSRDWHLRVLGRTEQQFLAWWEWDARYRRGEVTLESMPE